RRRRGRSVAAHAIAKSEPARSLSSCGPSIVPQNLARRAVLGSDREDEHAQRLLARRVDRTQNAHHRPGGAWQDPSSVLVFKHGGEAVVHPYVLDDDRMRSGAGGKKYVIPDADGTDTGIAHSDLQRLLSRHNKIEVASVDV